MLALLSTFVRWDGAASPIRSTLPMCSPKGSRLYEARTWSGSDWSGRRPLTSLTTWVSCAGGTSSKENSLSLMGRQAHVGAPMAGARSHVTDATSGKDATRGTGLAL